MAVADLSTTTAKVARQYETFPYPHRDPADEANRLLVTGLDDLDAVNHYCFQGRRDFRHGFRVLLAGGGTGDSTIFLAHQLARTDAQIVHLDLSDAAIDVARRRAGRRGLEQEISWVQGSLLDLPTLDLGTFDYINCTGVLHHLDDPRAGLAALKSVLSDGGAMGLMLYGRYGRTGVYHVQELMRMINRDEGDVQDMVENTKEVFAALPSTNWLKRPGNSLPDKGRMDDAEFYDMFLHAKDRPFSVPELYDLLDGCGLRLVDFTRTYRPLYDPRRVFQSPRLGAQLEKLPARQQQAVAEIVWGVIAKHEFWVSRHSDTVADPRDPDNVPRFTRIDEEAKVRDSILKESGPTWKFDVALSGGIKVSVCLQMSDQVRRLIELIDGWRTMGRIVQTMAAECPQSGSEEDVWRLCCKVLETLRMFDLVLLRHVSVPPMGAR